MKLSPEALLEIVDIVRQGFVTESDVSQLLRNLDLEPGDGGTLVLTAAYLERRKTFQHSLEAIELGGEG